ncbi:MAG: undecaprenyl/decaprenyl-phosphate alpha-N-acetylglucosaminyl 1-phosphate transferase [Aquificae bacterium]|nr:undecaprenyl/decaprenyl-phosphate alpha-N-acetylglucosaminyl 1-phosphate transferase [Aquificota bacterium]
MKAKKITSLKKLIFWGLFLTGVSIVFYSGRAFEEYFTSKYFYFLTSFLLSGSIIFLILRLISSTETFGDKTEKKHAIHTDHIPRIGGLAIFLSIFLTSVFFFSENKEIIFFILSSTIIFIIGLFEDYTQQLPPVLRLIMMSVPVIYILISLNGIIYDIYYVKLIFPIAVVFTIISVIGFINAINIIDGLNGLASGIALLGFLFFYLATENPTIEILTGIFFFATLAFFLVNITTGKIFLGDGGSYLLGFSLAEIAIFISNEPYLSPWFPFALLIYPVWEVLFSMLRRRKKGKSVMDADKLHLHTLLYRRYFRKLIKNPLKANSLTSLTILTVIGVLDIFVYSIRENVYLLTIYTLFFIIFYTYIYHLIVHFKLGKFINKIGKLFAYKKLKQENIA